MFTGIIEQIAEVVKVENEGSNLNITLKSNITKELKIDQSVAHNGVCLTVVDIDRSEEHTSELQSRRNLVCRLLVEKKKKKKNTYVYHSHIELKSNRVL